METIKHRYFWGRTVLNIILNATSFVYPVLFLLSLFSPSENYSFFEFFQSLFFVFLYWSIFFIAGNFFLPIDSEQDGLVIKYLWIKIPLPWESIIDMRPLLNISVIKSLHVIRTKRFTPAHRLLGLLYSFTLSPCICVHSSISNHAELAKRVKSRINKYQQNT